MDNICNAFDIDPQIQMHEMRLQGILCDAYITIPEDNVRLPVHRNVMASCSHYFRSLFTSGLKESDQNEIPIYFVSSSIMNQIIQYAYIRKVIITPDNVEDLLAAADRFHVFGLQKECSDFLLEQMTPDNCIGISKFSRFYNCTQLSKKAWKYVVSKFNEVVQTSQEYLQLDLPDLIEILEDDELCVNNESEVFEAIQRWVDYDRKTRKEHYYNLIKSMRLCFVSQEFFRTKLQRNKFLQRNKECHKLLMKAAGIIKIFRNNPIVIDAENTILRPRVPPEIIFTIGGWSSQGVVDSLETYDKNVDQWYEGAPNMTSLRAYHGTVFMSGWIYIIGGFDGTKYLNSMSCFCPERRQWEERAPMYLARCYVSAVELNGNIFSCGGFDGRQRHDSVERYDPSKNQWSHVQPMLRNRSDAGATTLDGKIYIAGGFDGYTCLESAEAYDPATNQWTMLQDMTSRRSGVVLVTFQKELVALGGYNGTHRLASAERFNMRNKVWCSLPAMNYGRSNFAAVVLDGRIVVIGGYDGTTTSQRVEMYDPTKKSWRQICSLNHGRSAVSACVVSHINSGKTYTYHGNESGGGVPMFSRDDDNRDIQDNSPPLY